VPYTTSCIAQPNSPEDGQNNCPKHVKLIGIISKQLLLHVVGCLLHYFKIFWAQEISFHVKYSFLRPFSDPWTLSPGTAAPLNPPNQNYAAARIFRLGNKMLNSGFKVRTYLTCMATAVFGGSVGELKWILFEVLSRRVPGGSDEYNGQNRSG
jgi:hypothetical protein